MKTYLPSQRKTDPLAKTFLHLFPTEYQTDPEFRSTWEDFYHHYRAKMRGGWFTLQSIKRKIPYWTNRSVADLKALLNTVIEQNWRGAMWEYYDNFHAKGKPTPAPTQPVLPPTKYNDLQRLYAGLSGNPILAPELAQQLGTLQTAAVAWLDAHESNMIPLEKGQHTAIAIWCRIIKDDFTSLQKKDPSVQLTAGWARNPKNDRWERALEEFSSYQGMNVRSGGPYYTAAEKVEIGTYFAKQQELWDRSPAGRRQRREEELGISYAFNPQDPPPRDQWRLRIHGVLQSLAKSQALLAELDNLTERSPLKCS